MESNADFKVNNFDLLRLMAATEVIFDHYFQHLGIPLTALQTTLLYIFPGVPVFFIISGYLISASFQRNNALNNYTKNRLLRIYPGLWGCIVVTVVVISLTGVSFLNKQTLTWLPAQLAGLIYTPGFLGNYGFGSYNGSLWTIPIELQFYTAVPALYLLIPKRIFTATIIALVVLFLAANVAYNVLPLPDKWQKLAGYSFVPHFYLFLFGVVLQRLEIYRRKFINGQALWWLLALFCFCLGAYRFLHPLMFELMRNLLLGLVVMALAYTWPRIAHRLLHGNDISYGIYIYHGLILTVMVQQKWDIGVFTLIALTAVLAALSWFLIERPFLRLKKRSIHPAGGQL